MSNLVLLGDVTSSVSTWTPGQCSPEDTFTYVDISSIDSAAKRIVTPATVPVSAAPSRARQMLKSGDVLVSSVRPNLNAVAVVPPELDGAIGSTGFAVLRPDTAKIHGRYLFHWVRSPSFVRDLIARATGASYPAVTESVIRESKVPLPALADQFRIAEMLDKADEVGRKRKESLRLLDEFMRSAFLEMFGDPATNRKGWSVVSLGDCLVVAPSIGTIEPARDGGQLRLVRVGQLGEHDVALDRCARVSLRASEIARFEAREDDLLLARAIGSEEHLGKASVVQHTSERLLFDSHVMRLRVDQKALRPSFLWHWLRTRGGRTIFLKRGGRTAVQFNINGSQVSGLPLPLPPLQEQDRFLDIANKDRALRTTQAEAQRHTNALCASLAQQAFSGGA